jgi:hypothetical protein
MEPEASTRLTGTGSFHIKLANSALLKLFSWILQRLVLSEPEAVHDLPELEPVHDLPEPEAVHDLPEPEAVHDLPELEAVNVCNSPDQKTSERIERK